eukprot:5186220-Ditylum_brightwellii.AAC.1
MDLGLWITYKPNILRDVYIETETDTLYIQSEQGHFVHHACSAGHMLAYEPLETYGTEPPTAAICTPIRNLNGKITCTHLINTFLLAAQQRSSQRILGNLQDQEVDTELWIAVLQAGIVETASDGSVKNGKGTYVVIFTAGERELWFQGPVDCHPS